jgi:cyclic-di-AMP phosphodiesterase PgpH
MSQQDGDDPLKRRVAETEGQSFFDRSIIVRGLIGFFLVIALLLFIHVQETRLESVEIGSIADRFLVTQTDFDFPDDEATLLLRQEALRDIGNIYSLNGEEVTASQATLQTFLSEDDSWREQLTHDTFEAIYRGIDDMAHVLIDARFTDPRTLRKMTDLGLAVAHYFPFTPVGVYESETIPASVWRELEQQAFTDGELHAEARKFIVNYFESASWNFAVDQAAVQAVRHHIEEMVPPARTHVGAGSRVIDRGDVVTARHVSMVQAMNRALLEGRNLWHPSTLIGSFLLTLLFVGISAFYLRSYHRTTYDSNKRLFILAAIVVLTLILSKSVEYLLLRHTANLAEAVRFPLLVPFAAILLCSLLNARVAAFISVFLAVLLSLTLAVDRSEFLVINLFAGLIAIMSTRSLRQRKEVFVVCFKAWLGCLVVVVAFHFLEGSVWSMSLLSDFLSTFLFMLITAVLVIGLVPLIESCFRMVTDITLTEYMDPTHPLLRRLSIEAPGTYQHSIVVGNLAESAAISIGANGLFCRVAALYHDIGKLVSPQYFVENQQRGWNIHQLLTPAESAQVILSHVPEGVALARKHSVPEPFIDIINEHHGTTVVYYFYHAQVELIGGDASKVDEQEFRYKGPKPHSKESTLVMIADTVEAASRSLDEANPEAVTELVERLIREKLEDGQFDESRLTFEELDKVKKTLIQQLVAAWHTRMAYPLRTTAPAAGSADDPAVPPEEA